MAMLRFLLRSAGPMAVFMGLIGLASGAFNAGLVAVVHQALVRGPSQAPSPALLWAFVGLGLGKVVSGYFAGVLLTSYSHESVAELRRELITKLLSFPYARFERMGRARMLSALTEDVSAINGALQTLPSFIVNLAVVAGGAAYLSYLSPVAFAALAALGTVIGVLHRAISRSARAYLVRARAEHDRLFGHFRALTDGTKELKQHVGRRRAFLDEEVLGTTEALLEQHLVGHSRYQLAQAVSSFGSLVAIAFILFWLPSLQGGAHAAVMSGYVLTALYLMGPLASVLRVSPVFVSAEIAHRRLEDLGVELGREAHETSAAGEAPAAFRELRLADVTHHYEDERKKTSFTLGPISLSILPSEIVFITGDNGSGKSTLAKLLLGLYEPEQGQVLWDGAPVTRENRDAYRQLFSAVHSDYFLFDSLLGLGDDLGDARAQALLDKLGLADRLGIEAGVPSSLQLSQGERRRLSLLVAYLEDRPFYVFDEWAADQDPAFKQTFYRELLPELRARGKAVVVITHDDRYFDVADRRVLLERGRVVTTTSPGGDVRPRP